MLEHRRLLQLPSRKDKEEEAYFLDYVPPPRDAISLPHNVVYVLVGVVLVLVATYAIVGHLIKDLMHDLAGKHWAGVSHSSWSLPFNCDSTRPVLVPQMVNVPFFDPYCNCVVCWHSLTLTHRFVSCVSHFSFLWFPITVNANVWELTWKLTIPIIHVQSHRLDSRSQTSRGWFRGRQSRKRKRAATKCLQ